MFQQLKTTYSQYIMTGTYLHEFSLKEWDTIEIKSHDGVAQTLTQTETLVFFAFRSRIVDQLLLNVFLRLNILDKSLNILSKNMKLNSC